MIFFTTNPRIMHNRLNLKIIKKKKQKKKKEEEKKNPPSLL